MTRDISITIALKLYINAGLSECIVLFEKDLNIKCFAFLIDKTEFNYL